MDLFVYVSIEHERLHANVIMTELEKYVPITSAKQIVCYLKEH